MYYLIIIIIIQSLFIILFFYFIVKYQCAIFYALSCPILCRLWWRSSPAIYIAMLFEGRFLDYRSLAP